MGVRLTLELPGEAADAAFLAKVAELYARHLVGPRGEDTAPSRHDGSEATRLVTDVRALTASVTDGGRWLLLAVAKDTLSGTQSRGKTLRREHAAEHGDLPNEGTLGAWVRSIRAAVARLKWERAALGVSYPDSSEAVYSMDQDVAQAVVEVLAPRG